MTDQERHDARAEAIAAGRLTEIEIIMGWEENEFPADRHFTGEFSTDCAAVKCACGGVFHANGHGAECGSCGMDLETCRAEFGPSPEEIGELIDPEASIELSAMFHMGDKSYDPPLGSMLAAGLP